MPSGLTIALVTLAQASSPAPSVAPPAATAPPPGTVERVCEPSKNPGTGDIVICAPKPQGYRLNPDVLEAKRELKSGGRPKSQEERMQPPSSCAVGPAGCQYAGINLIAAAVTAATIATRIAKGQEVGSMFVTDPHPDEYHLYLDAKARREQKEAEAKAKAVAEQARKAAGAAPSAPAAQSKQ